MEKKKMIMHKAERYVPNGPSDWEEAPVFQTSEFLNAISENPSWWLVKMEHDGQECILDFKEEEYYNDKGQLVQRIFNNADKLTKSAYYYIEDKFGNQLCITIWGDNLVGIDFTDETGRVVGQVHFTKGVWSGICKNTDPSNFDFPDESEYEVLEKDEQGNPTIVVEKYEGETISITKHTYLYK